MDYGILPPEVNSIRMYAGSGAGPMLAAAEAWQGVAAELHSAATSYQSVVSGLTAGSWSGPSSASMAAAATSYTAWLTATATQVEATAAQAKAAVAAYQAAFTSTVPPPAVAANRSQLTTLVATNVFGLNTQAIAATEAQYAEMWAQDAAAMYGYAASSASATTLAPFTPPQQNTNPGGSVGQSAAVSQATGTSAGNVQSTVSSIQQAFSAIPNALTSAAAPAQLTPLDTLDLIADLISIFLDLPADLASIFVSVPLGTLGIVSLPFDIGGYGTGVHTDDIISGWAGVQSWPDEGPAPVKPFPAPLLNLRAGTLPPPSLSAGLGEANTIGALSVPPTWAVATPAVKPISYTLPALPQTTATAGGPADGGSGTTLSEMALAGMAGRAMAGTVGTGVSRGAGKSPKGTNAAARPGEAAAVSGSKATGNKGEAPHDKPRAVVTGVAVELREFAKLRDEGILTDEEYTEQKNRLLGR
ncbi:MAG: PPE domain-containing protein [Mycobacterium sp.]|uniref:PPE family protein, SVP subgroup n=1 Tax=Mycobacterium sp. TaxID=1785 RepID=UPI003C92CAD8